jgi:hypothetical protein
MRGGGIKCLRVILKRKMKREKKIGYRYQSEKKSRKERNEWIIGFDGWVE